jgi:hypothetical protein
MKWTHRAAAILLFTALAFPAAVQACPLCAEAVAASNTNSGDAETNEFPKAMNQSIYLMVGVPYLTLGIVGFMIYRGCKKNAQTIQEPRTDRSGVSGRSDVSGGFSFTARD